MFVGLGVQVALSLLGSPTGGPPAWLMLIGTSVPLIVFLLLNRLVPGATWVAVGFLLNLTVIAANGAMPVSPRAAEAAGVPITREIQGPRHEVLTDETVLSWLADVIPVPPLQTVVSAGDVWLALAIAYLLYRATSPAGRHSIKKASGSEPAARP